MRKPAHGHVGTAATGNSIDVTGPLDPAPGRHFPSA